jgi:hypothetical protein
LRPTARRDLPELVVGALDGLGLFDGVAGDHVDVAAFSIGGHDRVTRVVLLPREERHEVGERPDRDPILDRSRQVATEGERAPFDERHEPVALLVHVGDQIVEELQRRLVRSLLDCLLTKGPPTQVQLLGSVLGSGLSVEVQRDEGAFSLQERADLGVERLRHLSSPAARFGVAR